MPRILVFGDSNTHGTPPLAARDGWLRYGPAIRWPGLLAMRLGPAWEVIEDGLPGRTAQFPDPVRGDHMDGRIGLRIALAAQAPLDVLAIMLGTNDCKARYGATPGKIAAGLAALIDIAQSAEAAARNPALRLVLVSPPPVQEAGVLAGEYLGGAAKSAALAPLLRGLARARGAAFLDAGAHAAVSPVDGVHMDPGAHAALAAAMADLLRAMPLRP